VCAYHGAQLSYTTQHRAVLIISHPNLQTITKAQMLSTGATTANDRQPIASYLHLPVWPESLESTSHICASY